MIKNQLRSLVAGLSSFFVTKKGNNTIDGNLYPSSNGGQDIGSSTNRFNNIYANNLIGVPAAPDELVKINASDPISGYLNDKIIVSTGILKSIVSNQLQLSADFNLFVPSTRVIESGNGLTGGGHLGADRTLAVGAGDGITVNADNVAVDTTVVRTTRTITSGGGLTGGGDLSANRTLAVGAGDGITVNADNVALTTPGTLSATTSNTASGNHTHAVSTGAASTLNATTSNATGTSSNLARADHLHEITTGAASTLSATTANATGTSSSLARADHLHAISTGAASTLTVSTSNATGTSSNLARADHLHTITTSSNPGAAASILASSASGSLQLVTLASNVAFTSGFAGAGYRVDYGVTETGKASAEFDNLTVRGRMRVYELLIQQIRATNGSVFVSSSSRAEVVTEDNDWELNGVVIELNGVEGAFDARIYNIRTRTTTGSGDRNLYHGFLAGDVLRAQRVDVNASGGEIVRQVNLEMTGFVDLWEYVAAYVSGSLPVAGDEMVRLGNVTDTTRQGAVYLTADDSGAPFIDIVDGVRSHGDWNTAGRIKARLGRLSGITDSAFGGNLSGYGLYSDNVYLKGQIVVTGGNAATTDALSSGLATKIGTGGAAADVNANTTTISGGKITTGSITAGQIAAGTITAGQIAAGTITAGQIAAGTITAAQIAAGTITADRIGVASLAAINANIGSATISDVLTIGTSGEIRQGTGTLGSNFTGLRVWRESNVGRIGGYNNNVVQWEGATDGRLKAGAGAVTLDANGVQIQTTGNATGYSPINGVQFMQSAASMGGMFGYTGSTTGSNNTVTLVAENANRRNRVTIVAQTSNNTSNSQVSLAAVNGFYAAGIDIYAADSVTGFPTINMDATEIFMFGQLIATSGIFVDSDSGGKAGTVGLSDVSNTANNGAGKGTIYMKGATNRDSAGFVKIYIGTTAYWVPVFEVITG